ncbi:MAG: hypothetical protein GWN93_19225 [Deltaproteobacteria bacterium]|nr:hypothetical protein [Deltaproteobacteria bacterium]
MKISKKPRLPEVLRLAMSKVADEMFVALPAKVEVYDPITQAVDVVPMIKRPYVQDDGEIGLDDLAKLSKVPVMWPRGGGYFLSFPLVKGDTGLLVFCDNSIENFIFSDGSTPLDPVDLRLHDISDGFFFPGAVPIAKVIKGEVSTGAAFGKELGAQLRATGAAMEVTTAGAPASVGGYVAMATLVLAELVKISTAIAALGGAYTPAPVASTNLKAD